MKKLILVLLLPILTIAQPALHNNCNPVPLDDYMFVLALMGVLLGVWYYQFNNVKNEHEKKIN
jgi:hypothetical protein